jgi:hypothetical protein
VGRPESSFLSGKPDGAFFKKNAVQAVLLRDLAGLIQNTILY